MKTGSIILLFLSLRFVRNNSLFSEDVSRVFFQVKKNEAICCLIGFGIGIGCCLMYRWLRNSFMKTEFFYNFAGNKVRYQQARAIQCSSNAVVSSDLQLATIDDDQLLKRSKDRVKKNRKKSKIKLKPSASQLLGNRYSTLASVSRAASRNVSKYLLSQPLSMIYENLAKYLAKEFFKNSSLKRSFLKDKPKSKHLKRNIVSKSHGTSENSPLRSCRSPNWANMLTSGDQGSKELCLSRKLNGEKALLESIETMMNGNSNDNSKMIQRKRAFLNDLNNRSLVYHLRLQQLRTKTSSNPFLSKVSKHEFDAINSRNNLSFLNSSPNHSSSNNRRLHDYLNGDPLSLNNNCLFASKKNLLSPHNRSLFDELSPSLGLEVKSPSKSELDSLYRSNSQMLTDLGIGFDEELQELFLNSSHRSSIYDFDDSSDSKSNNPMTKADNYVDKSLEEALHHIDKLKEDMNHLCKDIDSLYNIKGGSSEFATTFKDDLSDNSDESFLNRSYKLNNEDEEIDHIKSLIDSNNLIENNQLVSESMKHLRENLDQFKSKKQIIDQLNRACESGSSMPISSSGFNDEITEDQRCTCVYSDNYLSFKSNEPHLSSHDYFHCRNNFCANSITNSNVIRNSNDAESSNKCNEFKPTTRPHVNPVNSSRIIKRTLNPDSSSSNRSSLRKSSSFHKKSSSHYCQLSANNRNNRSTSARPERSLAPR